MKTELNNIEKIAVARSVGSTDEIGKLCKKLTPGTYNGKLSVTIDFSVEKNSDTEAAATSNILSIAVLAKAMILSGIQRQNFYNAIEQAALATGTIGDNLSEEDERVVAEIEALKEKVVAKLPKIQKSGATKVKAVVEKIVAVDVPETQANVAVAHM